MIFDYFKGFFILFIDFLNIVSLFNYVSTDSNFNILKIHIFLFDFCVFWGFFICYFFLYRYIPFGF